MRHSHAGRKLQRDGAHRRAMLRNLTVSLLREGRIRTTLPKARELRRTAEPLVTMAGEDSVARRRLVFARLRDPVAVRSLFDDFGPFYKSRPGGYLRVLKCGSRVGDCAPMAWVEWVDREDQKQEDAAGAKTPKQAAK